MLHIIRDLQDPYLDLIKDDPVRPEIPIAARVVDGLAEIFVLIGDDGAKAVTCVRYLDHDPAAVEELIDTVAPSVAVFYTIWSYSSGAGRELITAARSWIQDTRQDITRFVTLSPKTDMARVFHHRNGAITLRENADTVNYQYL